MRELGGGAGSPDRAACLAPLDLRGHPYENFHLLMPLYVCRGWKGDPATARGPGAALGPAALALRELPMPPADLPLDPVPRGPALAARSGGPVVDGIALHGAALLRAGSSAATSPSVPACWTLAATRGLTAFVFWLALPALLVARSGAAPLRDLLDPRPLAVFYGPASSSTARPSPSAASPGATRTGPRRCARSARSGAMTAISACRS